MWNFRFFALHAQASVGGVFRMQSWTQDRAKKIKFIVSSGACDEQSAISLGALSGSRSNPVRTIGNRMP